MGARVHIFLLGLHLRFGNGGGLGKYLPVKHLITIQDGGIESLIYPAFRSKITSALQGRSSQIRTLQTSSQPRFKYLTFMYLHQTYIYISVAIMFGLIIDPHNNQLPVFLIAQLVERCTAIAVVRVRNPFRTCSFEKKVRGLYTSNFVSTRISNK